METIGYTRITDSSLVNEGVTMLSAVSAKSAVSGSSAVDYDGTLTLYEGLDANTGRVVMDVEVEPDDTLYVSFPFPLRLDRGLYVVLGTHVAEVTLFWAPGGVR